jgi:hypothetical protein
LNRLFNNQKSTLDEIKLLVDAQQNNQSEQISNKNINSSKLNKFSISSIIGESSSSPISNQQIDNSNIKKRKTPTSTDLNNDSSYLLTSHVPIINNTNLISSRKRPKLEINNNNLSLLLNVRNNELKEGM